MVWPLTVVCMNWQCVYHSLTGIYRTQTRFRTQHFLLLEEKKDVETVFYISLSAQLVLFCYRYSFSVFRVLSSGAQICVLFHISN